MISTALTSDPVIRRHVEHAYLAFCAVADCSFGML